MSAVERYPDDYEPPTAAETAHLAELRAESADPEHWVDAINPGFDEQREAMPSELPEMNRVVNCCECARAVEDTLDGWPTVAAASDFDGRVGTDRITEWAGRPSEPATFSSIEQELSKPGDSAVVVVAMNDDWGHAFNAVNVDGDVYYVDGQSGVVEPWPPPFADDVDERTLEAWYFPGDAP